MVLGTVLGFLGSYVVGVVVVAAALRYRRLGYYNLFDDNEIVVASYLWPILVVLLIASIPYEAGRYIGKKLYRCKFGEVEED